MIFHSDFTNASQMVNFSSGTSPRVLTSNVSCVVSAGFETKKIDEKSYVEITFLQLVKISLYNKHYYDCGSVRSQANIADLNTHGTRLKVFMRILVIIAYH